MNRSHSVNTPMRRLPAGRNAGRRRLPKRSQTSMEYTFLIAGALLFVLLAFLALRSGAFATGGNRVANQAGNFLCDYGTNYLLYENFDDGMNKYFTPEGGVNNYWMIEGTQYKKTGGWNVSLSEVFATNFSYSAKTRYTLGFYWSGLVFRAQDSKNFYAAYIYGGMGDLRLMKNVGGVLTPIQTFTPPSQCFPNVDYVIRVDAYGNNLSFYLNGQYLGSRIDSTYSNGTFGLGGYGIAYYDDVKAWETKPC